MGDAFNYGRYFSKALNQVKALRDPYARKQETVDAGWYSILQNQIINIGAVDFRRPLEVIDGANKISIVCIYRILMGLIAERAPYCKVLALPNSGNLAASAPFVFVDTKANRLVVVKNIENDIALITEDYVPEDISNLLDKTRTTSYALVYLLHEKAELQFIAPDNDLSKTAHGKNVHSLPWLFSTYFGEDYACFRDELYKYTVAINEYIGYSVVRSLNPSALVSFKKITERSLYTFNYDQVIHKTIVNRNGKRFWLKNIDECNKLRQQYLVDGAYRILMSDRDYAESLITAEWLLDSMNKAHAIDLTVIGTGYFKAMEQLLFALIKLRDPAFDSDSTLGDYATFYKHKRDIILRNDVDWTTRNFVFEAIYEYADLRNGYFHKHNIYDPSKIQEIRSATYMLIYLILGCQSFNDSDYASLGIPNLSQGDDFSKLCEYIQFHKNSIFCVKPNGYPEQWIRIVPHSDISQAVRDTEDCPCIYYNVLGAKNYGRFSEKYAPLRIWEGKLKITHAQTLELDYEKTLLVFNEGKYVGPAIAEAEDFTY